MTHAEDVENQTTSHDRIAANDPRIEVLPPKTDIVLPCSLFQQHLCTSGSKDRQYDEYIKHAMYDELCLMCDVYSLAYNAMPTIITHAPIIFISVIASPKNAKASNMTKMRLVPLNI